MLVVGVQAVSTSVQRAVTVSTSDRPNACGTMEGILIQKVIESGEQTDSDKPLYSANAFALMSLLLLSAGSAKKCIKVGGEFYSSGKLDEAAGHKTAQNYTHQQGEPNTRAMDVRGRQGITKSLMLKSFQRNSMICLLFL